MRTGARRTGWAWMTTWCPANPIDEPGQVITAPVREPALVLLARQRRPSAKSRSERLQDADVVRDRQAAHVVDGRGPWTTRQLHVAGRAGQLHGGHDVL
jgi:hypothetical protein